MWGFLFLFDLRLNGFDLLPDFIGYILFYNGLGKLLDRHPDFAAARKPVIALIILSLPSLIEFRAEDFAITPTFLFFMAVGLVTVILDLYMVYHICRGIAGLAEGRGATLLQAKANTRWTLYLVLAIIVQVLMLSLAVSPLAVFPLAALLVIPLFVFSIVVLILMMALMAESEKQLAS